MERLIQGFHHFRRHMTAEQRELFARLASGQTPHTMFITCADSRVMPELMFAAQPGDIFVYRNVGNIVPPYAQHVSGVMAAIEYAVAALKVQHIVICGHSDCGAMKAVLAQSVAEGSALHDWLRHAEPSLLRLAATVGEDAEMPANERLCLANIAQQLTNLLSYPNVAAAVAAGKVKLVGMYFDIAAAKAFLVDPDRRALRDITV